MPNQLVTMLTIAGSDCSGGAGIQADIRAAASRGVFASTAVTAVTVQNSAGVRNVEAMSPEFLIAQIRAVFHEKAPDAIKIGMLGSLQNGIAIADFLKAEAKGIPIVVDPVMSASSGGNLNSDSNSIKELYSDVLLPLATVVTPNVMETRMFLGYTNIEEHNNDWQECTAIRLLNIFCCKSVVLKGGHDESDIISDVLAEAVSDSGFQSDKTFRIMKLSASKIQCANLHGTGCTFSSILAAEMAKGKCISEAFSSSFWAMKRIIADSCSYSVGDSQYGPLNVFGYSSVPVNKHKQFP